MLGRYADGSIVLFSAATGEVLARIPRGEQGASADLAPEPVLAYDASHHAAVALEGAGSSRVASVVANPIVEGDGQFGPPWRWSSAAHGSLVISAAQSLLLFEPSPAPRWRLVDDDGVSRANVLVGAPLSFWSDQNEAEWRAHAIVAESYPGAEPARPAVVRACGSETAIEQFEIVAFDDLEPSFSADAQLAPWPEPAPGEPVRADLVADSRGGVARLRWIVGDRVSLPVVVPTRSAAGPVRGFALITADTGASSLAALLVSSPPRLVAARIDGDRSISAVEEVELGAEPSATGRLARPLLAAGPDRLLVATADRVLAFRVALPARADAAPARALLQVEPSFDGEALRGPLAGPVPLNR